MPTESRVAWAKAGAITRLRQAQYSLDELLAVLAKPAAGQKRTTVPKAMRNELASVIKRLDRAAEKIGLV